MGERFEREFAAWLGVEDAVLTSSGTTALHLGVRMLGWGPGDEVVTSPFSFVASANCLLYEHARPVFVDVEPETLDLDPAAAAAAVGERTAGLLPVHIFGYPAAMPELEALAAKHGLGILEDACEAIGAVDSEGRGVGTRGNLATFAFYANKQMTTGEGGMIVPRDPDEAARLRTERNQGRAVDMGWLDHDRLGFNYRLSDLAAALGVAQVEQLDSLLERRAAVARALRASGSARSRASRRRSPGRGAERRSWFVYAVRLPQDADRDATIARLAERGIACKAYLPCIHLFPHLRELGYREGQFPVAEAAAADSLALPFFPAMSEAQVDRVCQELAAALGQRPSHGIIARPMARFRKDPDPRFWRLNRSLAVRLAAGALRHRPVARPRPRPAARSASSTTTSWTQMEAGLERVRARMAEPRLRVRGRRRGHPHGDRAPARRGDRAAGRQAPHRPLPQRPGRDRRGDGRPGPLAARRSSSAGRRWSGCWSWPRPTATGRCPATPTSSAPSRSTSATTCSPTSGCSPATCCASSSRSTAPA